MKTAKDLKIPFTWEERRPILLDRFFYLPCHYEYSPQSLSFFEEKKPIIIEYCSGNGQWIGDRALQCPTYNWIAVEKNFHRARQIWLKMHREEIKNLVVVCGEAFCFTKFYAPEVLEIYVNFPDPWPKLRHAKHRLITGLFLEELAKKVIGKATCVTDSAEYALEISQEFAKCPEWKLLFHKNEWSDYGGSFFKDLWHLKGRTIHYLSYERT